MGKNGTQCCVETCRKRRKNLENRVRSDSEGSDDDQSSVKRKFPRTFHAYVFKLSCYYYYFLPLI